MAKPLQTTTIVDCACGQVAVEAIGTPITGVICYCDDCSALFLNFDDSKHWADVYRSRCRGAVPPVQMRICTKFRREGLTIQTDVPGYPHYPISLLMKLIVAKAAMLIHR
jgi:hypothetical protein